MSQVDNTAAILQALARIEAKLDHLLDPDAARLQLLIPKIAAITNITGPLSFLISDLQGDVDFDGLSPKQVGKLLERNAGRTIGGYCIVAAGITREGREWRFTPVVAAPEMPGQSLPLNTHKGAAG